MALFLLPHPDDEVFILPWARDFARRGQKNCFVFLTREPQLSARKRSDESAAVLRLWLDSFEIVKLGEQSGIIDGSLCHHLNRAFDQLSVWFDEQDGSSFFAHEGPAIFTPAYEGGHPDHDAAFILGLALARKTKKSAWQFPLYQGKTTRGKFFSISRTLIENGEKHSRFLNWGEKLKILKTCWAYPSQRKTWAGLFPPLLWKMITESELDLQKSENSRLNQRPHSGPLLYERYGRMTFEEFKGATENFVQTHF